MTTERNGHDGAEVFAPVIGRLREELASFERQAAATRAPSINLSPVPARLSRERRLW